MSSPIPVPQAVQLPAAVVAAVLFGSRARGDWDEGSDVDVAVFAAADEFQDLSAVKDGCGLAFGPGRVSISVYGTDTAERLAAHGSLFLWHLRLEGSVLFKRSHWLERLLDDESLLPYDRSCALRDLETFGSVIEEVEQALARSETTALFEAATLFAVLRGVGMIVSMRSGAPCFGRLEPIHRLRAALPEAFQLTDDEVSKLADAKLIYSRRRSHSWHMAGDAIRSVASRANTLVEQVLGFID